MEESKKQDKEDKKSSGPIPAGISNMINSIRTFRSPFEGKYKLVNEEIEKVVKKEKEDIVICGEKCSVCNKHIKSFQYWSLRKFDYNKLNEDEEPQLIECNDFCSAKCLEEFKRKNSEKLEEYEFYRINRCSCYYDCEELDNLRRMCEKEERLDYEPGIGGVILHPQNFCDPGNASIIKASINIHKEVKKLKKETSFQFKLTAAMTILVIILTVVNLFITVQDDTASKFEELNSDLSASLCSINKTLLDNGLEMNKLNQKFENISKTFSKNLQNDEE